MRGEQLDGVIGLRPPEPGFPSRRADHFSGIVEQPRPRLIAQKRSAVVADHHLLAESVRSVDGRVDDLAFAAPDPDQRQQAQALGVQLWPFAQVRGVAGNRQVGEVGKVAGTSARGALGGEPQRLIAAQTVGAAGHPRDHRRSTRPTG